MFKLFAIPLAVAIGFFGVASQASAGGCGKCASTDSATVSAAPSTTAPAPSTGDTTARAPGQRSYRSYSYEPSASAYRGSMMRSSRGFRDAGSKVRSDYGR